MKSATAKKSLGQHFLTSHHYLLAIADAGDIKSGDSVLEIGPGRGSLTEVLLSRSARVVAVKKDHRLIPILQEKFSKEIKTKQLELVEEDILKFNVEHYVTGMWTLVGNIPYYITGALFEKFLGQEPRPERLVFLVQKEVGERIAHTTKESILSLSVKAYGEPRYIKTVPRNAFSPAPKVDSAIIVIKNISLRHFKNVSHEKYFFTLVHAGFAHKRKLLARNLEPVFGTDAKKYLAQVGIKEKARAEDVRVEEWLALASIKKEMPPDKIGGC